MRILVIEDNPKLADSITRGLRKEGYAAEYETNGLDGEKKMLVHQNDFDLLILDVKLPGKSGIDVCVSLRENGVMTPILMLTAQDELDDKVLGLDSGADDYMVKPFSFMELLSRVRALLRRQRTTKAPELRVGNLVMKTASQEVSVNGTRIPLTLKEFRMLEFFMMHPGEVLTRQMLVDHLWDSRFNPLSRTMDMHIKNLRNKLNHEHGVELETVRGIGYRLRE